MIFFELFSIAVIVCCIVDLSGIVKSVKSMIAKFLNIRDAENIVMKPFDCSLCMTFWCCLLWCLCCSSLTLGTVLASIVFAVFTQQITSTIVLAKTAWQKLLDNWFDDLDDC